MSGEPSTMGNNRIRDTRCLNQYSRQEAVLERFFFALGPKILFQQHRSFATFRTCFRHFRFTPNFGHVAASQRDASGTYLDGVGRRSSSGSLAKLTASRHASSRSAVSINRFDCSGSSGFELVRLGNDHRAGLERFAAGLVVPFVHSPATFKAGEPSRAVKYRGCLPLSVSSHS
jgi:hypothetical protein